MIKPIWCRFFQQPHATSVAPRGQLEPNKRANITFPSPLERFRIPTPRLVPRGYQ